jgi:hypothetical protein
MFARSVLSIRLTNTRHLRRSQTSDGERVGALATSIACSERVADVFWLTFKVEAKAVEAIRFDFTRAYDDGTFVIPADQFQLREQDVSSSSGEEAPPLPSGHSGKR